MDSKNYNDSLAISQDHDGILQITVTAIKVQPHQDSMLLTNIMEEFVSMEVLSKWLNLAKNYHETAWKLIKCPFGERLKAKNLKKSKFNAFTLEWIKTLSFLLFIGHFVHQRVYFKKFYTKSNAV